MSLKSFLKLQPHRNLILTFTLIMGLLSALIGAGVINLPARPFLLFLFFYAGAMGMSKDKIWLTAAGGFTGMIAGLLESLSIPALSFFSLRASLIIASAAIIMLFIRGYPRVLDIACFLMFAYCTYSAGLVEPLSFLPALGSYAIAVIMFAGIASLINGYAAD